MTVILVILSTKKKYQCKSINFVLYIRCLLHPEVALRLFKDHPQLATLRDSNEETALHALAGKSMMSSYLANQNQQGMLQNFFSSGKFTKL